MMNQYRYKNRSVILYAVICRADEVKNVLSKLKNTIVFMGDFYSLSFSSLAVTHDVCWWKGRSM